MGGPSNSTISEQQNLTQQQAQAAQGQLALENQLVSQYNADTAPLVAQQTALTSRDPGTVASVTAPYAAQIAKGTDAAKQQILNSRTPGAGTDFALANIPIQENAQITGTINSLVNQAPATLAQVGAGALGASTGFGGLGASLFGGASTSNQAVGQMQTAQSAGLYSILGGLLGMGGEALGGGLGGGLLGGLGGLFGGGGGGGGSPYTPGGPSSPWEQG